MKKLTDEQKQVRREARKELKRLAAIEAERNQRPVEKIVINIEWKKSRTWGYCPRATAKVYYKDGGYENREGYYASGCGYDKESTVIAAIFNDFLKYKLYSGLEQAAAPYGVHIKTSGGGYFDGGIGVGCYQEIAGFIGGEFKCLAGGKTFNVYEYTEE